MTSTILVTGGAGMIGSTLTKRLVASGHRVKFVDKLIDLDRDFHKIDLAVPARPTRCSRASTTSINSPTWSRVWTTCSSTRAPCSARTC